MHRTPERAPLALALALASLASNPALAEESTESITVVGKAVRPEAVARPFTVLLPEEIDRRDTTTLGAALDGLPGVAASGFGPNASRPVIRGQDGDHVRLLNNSLPLSDVSAMSFDHAVPVGVGVLDAIEILRGPAALLYGGNAVGGAINLVDRRVPRRMRDALSGEAELAAGGAAAERRLGAAMDGGAGALAWHVDGFSRRGDDVRAPRFTDDGEAPVTGTRIRNSSAHTRGGAVGGAFVDASGYAGLAVEGFDNAYGVPKETDVRIDQRQRRLRAAAERRRGEGWVSEWRLRAAVDDYRHDEIEAGAIATRFDKEAAHLRAEIRHRPIGTVEGVIGLQLDTERLRVSGEEAFLPPTRTRQLGVFALEEATRGAWTLRAGARVERARVSASRTLQLVAPGIDVGADGEYDADAGDAEGEVATDGPARERHFAPWSASVEAVFAAGAAGQWAASWSRVMRAPSNFELFAQGVHHASGLYESGDAMLDMEKGTHWDVGWSLERDTHRWHANLFASRFANYLTLIPTAGRFLHIHEDSELEGVPIHRYAGVPARFRGLEAGWSAQWGWGAMTVAPRIDLDQVHARRRDSDERLPRIAPRRFSAELAIDGGRWRLAPKVTRVADSAPSPDDTGTPGATLWSLAAQWRWPALGRQGELFVNAENLGDRLAYRATTVAEVRRFAPLPGRSVVAGLRMTF